MDKAKVRSSRADDSGIAIEEGLQAYFREALRTQSERTPSAPVERMQRRKIAMAETASRRPAGGWTRTILADVGFAACALAMGFAGFAYGRENPGLLARELVAARDSGGFERNVRYIAESFDRYLESRSAAPASLGRFR